MKNKNVRNWKILVAIMLLIVILTAVIYFCMKDTSELKTIKSEKELEKIYEGRSYKEGKEILINIIGMPFSLLQHRYVYSGGIIADATIKNESSISDIAGSLSGTNSSASDSIQGGIDSLLPESSSSSKDYSTTNIQVENVDEADITKTDGNYIYSISENNVVITNVMNPGKIKIAAKISSSDNSVPEDLILCEDKLVVIATETTNSSSYYYYNNNNTIVKIYDITNRETPKLLKNYKLYEPYYTSRCIGNKLYVISSGNLKKEDDKIVTYYTEDYEQKEIGFDHMQYLDEIKTRKQTLISMLDLNHAEQDVKINSYLIDISNAYVSENNIYLLDQDYEGNSYVPPISSLFGFWGAIGPFKYEEEETSYGTYTKIYKFNILEDGTIKYSGNTKAKGKTINQYSVDEYEGNLRLALYDNSGSRVVIFDKNLNEIGKTSYLAKGENMYSSRFMGNKAYLVTYRTMDPLYVIDLSDETHPKVLGELKIPGYSTYLHPYDENHLIGIGMETKETINRDSYGRVISTSARIVGMKMALFDVSDVRNPIQISSTVIGDSRTTSAILTNPKALLFSKEKELIAIPVNNYASDFSITSSADTYSSIISSYTNNSKSYISEGYAVYKINLDEGFKLKGTITHSGATESSYGYRTMTKLLRGVYIDENLYTVSENQIKVNRLDTLQLVDEINLQGEERTNNIDTINSTNELSQSNTMTNGTTEGTKIQQIIEEAENFIR